VTGCWSIPHGKLFRLFLGLPSAKPKPYLQSNCSTSNTHSLAGSKFKLFPFRVQSLKGTKTDKNSVPNPSQQQTRTTHAIRNLQRRKIRGNECHSQILPSQTAKRNRETQTPNTKQTLHPKSRTPKRRRNHQKTQMRNPRTLKTTFPTKPVYSSAWKRL